MVKPDDDYEKLSPQQRTFAVLLRNFDIFYVYRSAAFVADIFLQHHVRGSRSAYIYE